MFKACLFDLDGVIVDTAVYHYKAWCQVAEKYDFEFSEEHNERLKGVSRMDSLDILLEVGGKELSQEQKEQDAAWKNDIYCDYISRLEPDEILPGAIELLDELRAKGIKIALGSASKNAPTILERLGLTNLFDAIIDGNKVSKAKPDPEVFLKGAEALGVAPESCVVFEDAFAGIEAAKAGGMRCVGVGSPEVLGDADWVVTGLHEVSFDKLQELFNGAVA